MRTPRQRKKEKPYDRPSTSAQDEYFQVECLEIGSFRRCQVDNSPPVTTNDDMASEAEEDETADAVQSPRLVNSDTEEEETAHVYSDSIQEDDDEAAEVTPYRRMIQPTTKGKGSLLLPAVLPDAVPEQCLC